MRVNACVQVARKRAWCRAGRPFPGKSVLAFGQRADWAPIRPYLPAMAAPILSYEDLGLIQGEGWLFRELDIYIGERDRLALIGRNGAGKTTLLKCLAALIDPDKGKRTIVPGTHVVLLEQDPIMDGHETLHDWVVHGPDAP